MSISADAGFRVWFGNVGGWFGNVGGWFGNVGVDQASCVVVVPLL
jgi:hypothetical protein